MRVRTFVAALTIAIAVGACTSKSGDPEPQEHPRATSITFPGVGTGGVFDPSLANDPATGRLWMSYSAVDNSVLWPTQNAVSVHVRLAQSSDGGETWTDAGAANQIKDVTLPLAPPNQAGTWVNEVSSLAYDPGAPASQRWKLVWQTFLKINSAPRFEHSWIALRTASTPQGLLTAPTIKLFTSRFYDAGNNDPNGPTQPPLGGPAEIQFDTEIDPALADCTIGEPSLLGTAQALYLAIQCERAPERHVMLLKCMSPCNLNDPTAWAFVKRIFSKTDAVAANPAFTDGFAAPALVSSPTGFYLVVTPAEAPDALYRGCRVYKFVQIETGELEKAGGVPRLIASSGPASGTFNGACAFSGAASASGMLRSELGQHNPPWNFQILRTRLGF